MPSTQHDWGKEYDFVIVGGGTSGLVLADRLSECGTQRVLVLEAGPSPDHIKMHEAPGGVPFIAGTSLDWVFKTEPQKGLDGTQFTYHRGRCLGGSTVINGLFYGRGSAGVYNQWSSKGNPGWDWEGVYPYFVKGTHFNPPNEADGYDHRYQTWEPSAYGDGPLEIAYQGYVPPSSVGFIEACQDVGIPIVHELNTGDGVGIKQGPGTINAKFERSSAYNTYYKRAESRSNVDIITNAPVQSLKWDSETGSEAPKVSGVVFIEHATGLYHTVTAKKEVIVTIGTFQSPQLLMVSGIGPKDVLEGHGIKLRSVNENVGKHMIDHTVFSIMAATSDEASTHRETYHLDTLQDVQAEYYTKGTGPYTAPTGITNGYQQLPTEKLKALGADAIVEAGHVNQAHMEFLYESVFFPNGPTPSYIPSDTASYITITASNMVPLSRGSVGLRSNSMSDAPAIDPNYFSHPVDKTLALNAFRDLRKILAHRGLSQFAMGPDHGEVSPGVSHVPSDDDDAIWEYIKTGTHPGWHPVGTNRMLPREQGGVVDARLRVYGVRGLRVCDSSIMPTIPDVCIQGSVYMIGEKGATMIREDWGLST